jgi:hypothetical protein
MLAGGAIIVSPHDDFHMHNMTRYLQACLSTDWSFRLLAASPRRTRVPLSRSRATWISDFTHGLNYFARDISTLHHDRHGLADGWSIRRSSRDCRSNCWTLLVVDYVGL